LRSSWTHQVKKNQHISTKYLFLDIKKKEEEEEEKRFSIERMQKKYKRRRNEFHSVREKKKSFQKIDIQPKRK